MSGPAQAFVKIDLQTGEYIKWTAEKDEFISEVAFAAKKPSTSVSTSEDDGYLMLLTSKTSDLTSELLIFSASGRDIIKGPIVRLKLPTYIPYGLHGMFAPNAVFEFDDILRRFKVSL